MRQGRIRMPYPLYPMPGAKSSVRMSDESERRSHGAVGIIALILYFEGSCFYPLKRVCILDTRTENWLPPGLDWLYGISELVCQLQCEGKA